MNAPTCPYCSQPSVFVDSAEVYGGKSYGMIYLCRPCQAWVGCHKVGAMAGQPLGRLADAELRNAKKTAHAVFDPLWKSGRMSREFAYEWLAKKLLIPRSECHIGMFDLAMCQLTVHVCFKKTKGKW